MPDQLFQGPAEGHGNQLTDNSERDQIPPNPLGVHPTGAADDDYDEEESASSAG